MVSADGSFVTTGENEGSYVPACKINYVRKGDFMGVPLAGNGRSEQGGYTKPLCFLPMNADNSGAAQVQVPAGVWGDFANSMLHLSYGKSSILAVIHEEIEGKVQGGAYTLPISLNSAAMRARFHKDTADFFWVCCSSKVYGSNMSSRKSTV